MNLLFTTLPWLAPFGPGPSPIVLSALISLGACAGLVLMAAIRGGLGVNSGQDRGWAEPAWQGSIASGWLAAAVLSSIAALLQYFHAADALQPWVSVSDGTAFANLRQRNQFATLTVIGFSALLWVAQTCKPRRQFAVGAVVMGMLLIAGDAASASRTGMVALALVVVAVWLWRASCTPWVKGLAAVAMPLYAVFAVLLPALSGHAGHWGAITRLAEGDTLCGSRLTLWSNVLHLIAQKPWLGWGWGELNYAHYATLYPDTRFCEMLDNAHNLPLHLAVTLGAPFATAFCAGLLWWIVRAKPWAETHATRQLAWLVLMAIGLHSLLEYPLWYGPFQMAVLLCIALLWATPHGEGDPAAQVSGGNAVLRSNSTFALIFCAFLAMLLIVFASYAAWDYHRISQIYLQPAARSAAYRDDTLNKAKDSWLFQRQIQFAVLSTTPLTQANAAEQYATATQLLHFSPEVRVIERVIESALILHLDEEVARHMARYRAAFPQAYAAWMKRQG